MSLNTGVSDRRHRGLIHVWLLAVLLPGSLVLSVAIVGSAGESGQILQARHLALLDARDRLLAYTTAYASLYSGSGAGPGHFPCPDSDGFGDSALSRVTIRDDGPNPPCGSGAYARGWLARRIVTGLGRRVLLHDLPEQHIVYIVDTRLINNPINRVVNDIEPASLAVAAWLMLPAPHSSLTAEALAQRVDALLARTGDVPATLDRLARTEAVLLVPVEVAAWREPMRRRVADWLRWRLSPTELADNDDGLFDRDGRRQADAQAHEHWFTRNRWWSRVHWVVDDLCHTAEAHCLWSVTLPAVVAAPDEPAMIAHRRAAAPVSQR